MFMNSRVPHIDVLEETKAQVKSDGRVFWSRPGVIEMLCQFSGLVNFPFDDLGCRFELGGWMYSGGHQGIALLNGGFSLDRTEPSARQSYMEMYVDSVNASVVSYEYPCCPSEPWPYIIYDFKLARASFYYINFYIWPMMLITLFSFGAFFMSPDVGPSPRHAPSPRHQPSPRHAPVPQTRRTTAPANNTAHQSLLTPPMPPHVSLHHVCLSTGGGAPRLLHDSCAYRRVWYVPPILLGDTWHALYPLVTRGMPCTPW